MFIFRKIIEDDIQFKLITDNKAFDDLAPEGSLNNYVRADIIRGGNYLNHILLEEIETNNILLGLLRYRIVKKEVFIEDLKKTTISSDLRKNLDSLLSLKKYNIVYLSRIDVSQEFQEMRISQIINNFFEFLIQREKKNCIIYAKLLKNLTSVVGSKYRILGEGIDEDWGEYFLVSKIIEYNTKRI